MCLRLSFLDNQSRLKPISELYIESVIVFIIEKNIKYLVLDTILFQIISFILYLTNCSYKCGFTGKFCDQ